MKYYIYKESKLEYTENEKDNVLIKIKDSIKEDDFFVELFNQYNKSLDIIDAIPIDFVPELEVSAQTINGSIRLNWKLLGKPFSIIMRYVVHEMVHVFQHMDGLKESDEGKNYLDDPNEVEAFQQQIKFDANNNSNNEEGKGKAVEYAKKLIKFHKYPKSKRKNKLKELTEGIDDDSNNTNKPDSGREGS
tara:strand:+ start:550 stop:1119 length:570 start_codon:yes stop_codon:yes gene_type:complete